MKEITEEVKRLTKELDLFTIRGNTFYYTVNDICLLISIEKSRFNLPGQEAFWFNVSGYVLTNPPLKSFSQKSLLSESHIVFTERASVLWNVQYEQYTITSDSDRSAVLSNIKTFLNEFLAPTCREIQTLEDLIHFLQVVDKRSNRNKYNMGIAMTLAKMGDLEKSIPFFRNAEGDKEMIQKIAMNMGVNIGV